MFIKTLILCFIVGLSSLSLMSCSDDHEHGSASSHGHSHAPADAQLGQNPDKTVHDNIDSK